MHIYSDVPAIDAKRINNKKSDYFSDFESFRKNKIGKIAINSPFVFK